MAMPVVFARRSSGTPRARVAAIVVVAAVLLLVPVLALAFRGDTQRAHAAEPAAVAATPASANVPASAPRAVLPHRVFVVGDSLTVGTDPYLRAALHRRGWTLAAVNARVGRPVSEGFAVLRAHRATLPPVVLIALGTNNLGSSPQDVKTWLRTARSIVGTRPVVWVNLCLNDAQQPRLRGFRTINSALAKFAPRFGITVADWCGYAGRHGVTNGPDGIHYGPAAYRVRARFYAIALAAL
jgi:lysophospholipase L1-like esterase